MIVSDRMAAVDENAEALGIPRSKLMESSGNAVAREVREVAAPGSRVVLVCGRGNNGGDAFVTARFLADYEVSLLLLGRAETITTEIARENWDALQETDVDATEVRDSTALELPDADVIVDALLGTGASGEPREPVATAVRAINDTDAAVVAVDVPTGVDADTGDRPGVAVETDHVVTFHDEKPGLADLDCSIRVADIGIPAAAERYVGPGDLRGLTRDPTSHKGDHGAVLVIGGGPYSGAPALSAHAALRAGADLVHLAVPAEIVDTVRGYAEDFIVHELPGERFGPEAVEEALALSTDADVTLLGPGLGDAEETMDAARGFLDAVDGTVVVDADPLRVVPDAAADASLLCTPHQGEFRNMGGEGADDPNERAETVESFAAETGTTMLVKGAVDVISDGERTRLNRTGNPGMTVGGTGDVLAGVTAALASVLDPFDAAAVAAYVNGRAGDLAVDERGHGLTASDLHGFVPRALWGDRDD